MHATLQRPVLPGKAATAALLLTFCDVISVVACSSVPHYSRWCATTWHPMILTEGGHRSAESQAKLHALRKPLGVRLLRVGLQDLFLRGAEICRFSAKGSMWVVVKILVPFWF